MKRSKGSPALKRFNWEYRAIRDEFGHSLGWAIPSDSDTRKPHNRMAGERSGFLVVHKGRNRARRRELGRAYGTTIDGTNRPHIGKLNVEEVFSIA